MAKTLGGPSRRRRSRREWLPTEAPNLKDHAALTLTPSKRRRW